MSAIQIPGTLSLQMLILISDPERLEKIQNDESQRSEKPIDTKRYFAITSSHADFTPFMSSPLKPPGPSRL